VKVVGYTLFQNSSGMAHSRDDRRERQRKESSFHFKGNTVAEKKPNSSLLYKRNKWENNSTKCREKYTKI